MKTQIISLKAKLILITMVLFMTSCIKSDEDIIRKPTLSDAQVNLVELNVCDNGGSQFEVLVPYEGDDVITKLLMNWEYNDGTSGSYTMEDVNMQLSNILCTHCIPFGHTSAIDYKMQVFGENNDGEEYIVGSVDYTIIRPLGAD